MVVVVINFFLNLVANFLVFRAGVFCAFKGVNNDDDGDGGDWDCDVGGCGCDCDVGVARESLDLQQGSGLD